MVLGTNAEIKEGGGKIEREWKVYVVDGQRHILLTGERGLIADLKQDDDGVYRGRWTQFEGMEVELVPEKILLGDEQRQSTPLDLEKYTKDHADKSTASTTNS
jgi:hypothetical protein